MIKTVKWVIFVMILVMSIVTYISIDNMEPLPLLVNMIVVFVLGMILGALQKFDERL